MQYIQGITDLYNSLLMLERAMKINLMSHDLRN